MLRTTADPEYYSKLQTDVINLYLLYVASIFFSFFLVTDAYFEVAASLLTVFSKHLPQHTHLLFWVGAWKNT